MFKSQLNPAQRDSALKSLASEEFDVLVIGGELMELELHLMP
jgi:glycerol-3-phosphate dehydrogenase